MNHFENLQYFDFKTHWQILKPIFESPQARAILDRDFENYIVMKRANYIKHAKSKGLSTTKHGWYFTKGKLPFEYDSCDWRCDCELPAWHEYVCHGACHWLVNTLLHVAVTAYPSKSWRIVTSIEHSTIWDGAGTLFDLNYATMGVPVKECVSKTFLTGRMVMLDVGEYLVLGHNYYQ